MHKAFLILTASDVKELRLWTLDVARKEMGVVRKLLQSGREVDEVSCVAWIRVSPVLVPLFGDQWWKALVPVLLRVPVIVSSVFRFQVPKCILDCHIISLGTLDMG
ncbi:hypothetical protein INR49_008712 [Caranx melampygus]|nr:hypothetical protein INR49_008712 [Caranx melampygus]